MGIQIKGSNDTISASDGSMTLEGQTLSFTNENITGISTMATGHITGTATIDDDLKVGISTLFVDVSTGRVGINTISPQAVLQVNDNNPAIAGFWRKNGGTNDEARISLGALSTNIPSQRGVTLTAVNNGAGHDFIVNTSNSHAAGPTEKVRVQSSGHVGITSASPTATRFSGSVSGLLNLAGTKPCIYISETDSKDSAGVNKALYLGVSGGTVYCGSNTDFTYATGDTTTSQRLKIDTSGHVSILTGNVGILTSDVNTEHIAGAASSFIGLYMNDGFIGFPTALNRDGGYFIATHVNALNAGPVSLGSSMTLHGTWTIV